MKEECYPQSEYAQYKRKIASMKRIIDEREAYAKKDRKEKNENWNGLS